MEHKNEHTIIGEVSDQYGLKQLSNSRVCEFKVHAQVGKSKAWLRVKAWNEAADVAEGFQVGDVVGCRGPVTSRSYDGKNGKVYVTETVVNEPGDVKLLEKGAPQDDSDLPF